MIFKILLFLSFFSCAFASYDLSPHLLPSDHPLKVKLDAIFIQSRALLNCETLLEAGFLNCQPRKFTHIIVTKHKDFPGYIFKLQLDCQSYRKNKPESHYWFLRAQGALKTRNVIKAYGLESFFKVPQKWIYRLPEAPSYAKGYLKKEYILVEEDMQLLATKDNRVLFASDLISFELLNYLYIILNEVGLSDCLKPDNIPFSIDGRISFIDTEQFGAKKIKFSELSEHLSNANQKYWNTLID